MVTLLLRILSQVQAIPVSIIFAVSSVLQDILPDTLRACQGALVEYPGIVFCCSAGSEGWDRTQNFLITILVHEQLDHWGSLLVQNNQSSEDVSKPDSRNVVYVNYTSDTVLT
jgi:hypothetical protein